MKEEITKVIANTAYQTYERRLQREVLEEDVPHHVAIIMDGNRRFAREFGLAPNEGHVKGKEKLEEVMEWCLELGIKVLTVYAFSTENLLRQAEQAKCHMDVFDAKYLKLAKDERIHKHHIRLTVIGQIDLLPENVQQAIRTALDATKDYDSYYYNIALAYGSRQEIVQAIRSIVEDVKQGKLDIEGIDERTVSSYMYTAQFPDPDLVLRTSGEVRVSNFLLWQLAYSELYFTDVYWPGFRKVDFLRAIRTYQQRKRRFGK
jgi:tritrans,polycis-undecaprenyl-diphosphate synthase [geranylgeranyl-diphosphate specific]